MQDVYYVFSVTNSIFFLFLLLEPFELYSECFIILNYGKEIAFDFIVYIASSTIKIINTNWSHPLCKL